jgi:hypothetical protein
LRLRRLLSLSRLQRSSGLCGVRLSRFGSSRQSLCLLNGLHFSGFSGLNGLSRLGCLGRLGECSSLSRLCGLRDLSSLCLFGCDDSLRLLGRLSRLSSELRLRLLSCLSGCSSLSVLSGLCLVSRLLGDRCCTAVSYSVAASTSA